MQKTRKAVILNNISSPYIQQAIIILKEYEPAMESKILADAERIVDDYMTKSYALKNSKKSKKRRVRAVVLTLVLLAAAALLLLSGDLIP